MENQKYNIINNLSCAVCYGTIAGIIIGMIWDSVKYLCN